MPVVNSSSVKRDPVPSGIHQAVFASIIDLGTQLPDNPKFSKARKVYITWELVHETFTDGDGNTKRRRIGKEYSLSLNKKANFRKMLASFRGRDLSEAEAKTFDTDTLLGVNCQVVVNHKAKVADPSAIYASVEGVVPLTKGMAPAVLDGKPYAFNIPLTGAIILPESMPEWLSGKIKESEEWVARHGGATAGVGATSKSDEAPF